MLREISLYFVLCEQYDKLMEEFKSTHKESENIKSAGSSTAELRADIEAMEKEHNIVLKKIERMQRKVGSVLIHEIPFFNLPKHA